MGWGDLALGGLDIVEFPFNPHAMLVDPYAKKLADALIASMNQLPSHRPDESRTEPTYGELAENRCELIAQ